MKIKAIFISVFFMLSTPLFSFEVNTHQAIKRLAIGEYGKVEYQRGTSWESNTSNGVFNVSRRPLT